MQKILKYFLISLLPSISFGATTTFSFATPVTLTNTETPGAWYIDRYPPHGFTSPVTAPDGTINTLDENINAADSLPNRPPSFQSTFYNTQGRHYDMPASTTSVSISLYVPASYATVPHRVAGFWGVAFDSTNQVGDYPIVEFQGPIPGTPVTSDPTGEYPNNGVPGFYGFDNVNGGFVFIGLPPGFTYNSWVQITLTLIPGTGFKYTVTNSNGSVSLSPPATGTGMSDSLDSYLQGVILEGYNHGATYDIFWDGLSASTSTTTLPLGTCALFPVTLAVPAGPNGADVTLTTSDPSKITFENNQSSVNLVFAPGSTTPEGRTPQVCGVNLGTATITATGGAVSTGPSVTIQVTATLSFSPTSATIAAGQQERLSLSLSAPAPAGGLTVHLSSGSPGVATVPATVTIPANSQTVTVTVTGVADGSATIHASVLPNVPDTTASITVSH